MIAIHLATNYGRRHAQSRACVGLPPHKLSRVLAFIREHITDAIRVDHLASMLHMSPCHFARMFRQAVGQPPHAYITSQRMRRAKELLRESCRWSTSPPARASRHKPTSPASFASTPA